MSTPAPGLEPVRSDPAEPDADQIAAIASSCESVVGLHGGWFGEVATYFPGRRLRGVRVGPIGVAVHVIGRYPVPAAEIDLQLRTALTPVLCGLPLTVTIEDYARPESVPTVSPATGPSRRAHRNQH